MERAAFGSPFCLVLLGWNLKINKFIGNEVGFFTSYLCGPLAQGENMNKLFLSLALISCSLGASEPQKHCCQPAKADCCKETCCKAADHCCKGPDAKGCKVDCKEIPAPKG